ncbi:hypothetical protein DSO57_1036657 [Entomophthora muscae]|uniref:Uncharacterized protein n=1 Tax=Entomophthora muscae TaxID=34485 RepID=A0ACC2S140_9FUNG|nr:hypothetical protein DSO57_1036657 [Entomophthora muscae]
MPLSVTTAKPNMPAFVLEGASHARDLGYPSSKDTPPVKKAKELSLQLIAQWLTEDPL